MKRFHQQIKILVTFSFLFFFIVVIPVSYSWSHNVDHELDFQIVTIESCNGVSKLKGMVTNTTNKRYQIQSFQLILYDENKHEIFHEPIYIGDYILEGESREFQIQVTEDLTNTVTFDYQWERSE